jgi:hypothetical protein
MVLNSSVGSPEFISSVIPASCRGRMGRLQPDGSASPGSA